MKNCSERIVFGGATIHAAGGYAAGEEGVMAQGRSLLVSSKAAGYVGREFMKESIKAEERQLPVISSEALAQFKCSFINKGHLLIRFDEIPPVAESGECCLCRYTKDRLRTLALATSYVSCYGKDRANVAKWTYPIETCDKECNKKNILPGMSTPVKKNSQAGHGSRNTKILFVAVLCLLIFLVSSVCFCWVRQKRDLPQTENRRFSSPGRTKGRLRRRSLGGSPSV